MLARKRKISHSDIYSLQSTYFTTSEMRLALPELGLKTTYKQFGRAWKDGKIGYPTVHQGRTTLWSLKDAIATIKDIFILEGKLDSYKEQSVVEALILSKSRLSWKYRASREGDIF